MTVGNSIPGVGSFVATDLRRGIIVRQSTGEVLSNGYDGGGKLVETPSGWATGTGGQAALDAALDALRLGNALEASLAGAGYRPASFLPNEHSRLLRSGERILTSYSDDPAADPDRIALMTISRESPDSVTLSNGLVTNSYSGGVHITLPSDHTREDLETLIQRALREYNNEHRLAARIRIAAGYFSEVSLRTRLASREVEFGCISRTPDGPQRLFLRGNSTEIAATEPDQIFERFAAVPVVFRQGVVVRPATGEVQTAAFNPQGSGLPTTLAALPFSFNSGGPATNRMWASFTWSAITVYRPDGTTLTIPASSSYATPPSPTLSQVAGGSLGARTDFVRIGYIKNHMIVKVGAEGSFAISANNLLKVTSPAAVAGYSGWIPLVGSATNAEYAQTEFPFGSDFTESVSGFNNTTTSPYDNTFWPTAVIARELPASSTVYFYPYYDVPIAFVAFASRGATTKNDVDAAVQNGDGHYPLSFGGMNIGTPAGGGTTSGLAINGGGRLL